MTNLDFLLDKCDDREKNARLRELRVLVAVYCGWDCATKIILDGAIAGEIAADDALRMVDALPARLRRRVLASFGALGRP